MTCVVLIHALFFTTWGFRMNRIILAAGLALAQLFAVNAMAQSKGEADPAQSKAIPSKPATAEEKAAAKATRKAEGKVAAKEFKGGEGPDTAGKAKVATKEQRAEAAKARKAAAQSALKKGEISSGEK
jgi:hypothetical protein